MRRAGRKRKFERATAKRATIKPPPLDRGTTEQQYKRAVVVAGYESDERKSYLDDPLGLLKLKGLISVAQERAGQRFSNVYTRIFGSMRVISPSFDVDYVPSVSLSWDLMDDKARSDLKDIEIGLVNALEALDRPERTILYECVLVDVVPNWLRDYRKGGKDEVPIVKEYQDLWSALDKLSIWYGIK